MKQIISVAVALAVFSGTSAFAKKLTFAETPQAVQKTIVDQKLGNEKAMTIKEDTENGKTVYQVTLKRDGKDVKLWVASDGAIVKSSGLEGQSFNRQTTRRETSSQDSGVKAAFGKGEKLRLGDAPVAVQNAVKERFGNAENAELKRETKDGQQVYQVEIKQEGKNEKLWVAEDGSIIEDNRNEGLASKLGLKKIAFNDLPAAAQTTIRSQAGTAEIGDIKTESKNGKTIYKVELKQEGRNQHVWVSEDGSIVKDERRAGEAVSEKAGAEKTERYGETKKSERNLAFTDVPKPVQDAITKEQGVDAQKTEAIKINKRTKDGKTFYEVKFKKEGKDMELHIDENGAVLPEKDSRR